MYWFGFWGQSLNCPGPALGLVQPQIRCFPVSIMAPEGVRETCAPEMGPRPPASCLSFSPNCTWLEVLDLLENSYWMAFTSQRDAADSDLRNGNQESMEASEWRRVNLNKTKPSNTSLLQRSLGTSLRKALYWGLRKPQEVPGIEPGSDVWRCFTCCVTAPTLGCHFKWGLVHTSKYFCLFRGHTWYGSGITPGCAWGTILDVGDWTQVAMCKGNYPLYYLSSPRCAKYFWWIFLVYTAPFAAAQPLYFYFLFI